MRKIVEGFRCDGKKEYIVDKEIGYKLRGCFIDLCGMLKEWLPKYYNPKNPESFKVNSIFGIDIMKPKGKIDKIKMDVDYSALVNGDNRKKNKSVITLPLNYLSEDIKSYIDCMFETLYKEFNSRISYITLFFRLKSNYIPVVDVQRVKDYIHIEVFECDEKTVICRKLSDTHKDSSLLNYILCNSKIMVKALEDVYGAKGIIRLRYNVKSDRLVANCVTFEGYNFETKWVLNEVPINIRNILKGIINECNVYFPNRTLEMFSINTSNNEVLVWI